MRAYLKTIFKATPPLKLKQNYFNFEDTYFKNEIMFLGKSLKYVFEYF